MADDKKFPWSKSNNGPAPFEAVYAGPQAFCPPPVFQAVYAGPDFYNPQNTPAGAYAPPAEQTAPSAPQDDPNAKYCPNCGNKVFPDARFCHECGAVLPQTK